MTSALRLAALAPAALSLGLSGGCLVDSMCQADYDCSEGERCQRPGGQLTGHCAVECTSDLDCYVNGAYIGKDCVQHRCQFRFDQRVAAPNFCLKVLNQPSSYYGQDFCLSAQKGKVVLLYFAWLT